MVRVVVVMGGVGKRQCDGVRCCSVVYQLWRVKGGYGCKACMQTDMRIAYLGILEDAQSRSLLEDTCLIRSLEVPNHLLWINEGTD